MIEITGNDIAELNDEDLRTLIGLLCEAELRSSGLPTAGVSWGGHQNAKDGGVDVRVEISITLHKDNFIPRPKTGFQVKKPDMPRASIINEMCPNGKLREVIKEIVNSGGAYIIVSSQGSTADSALKNRIAAMKEALSDYTNTSNAKVDFYDRGRIAAWVRSHPSLVLWVRGKIGRPIQGWKPYGNWSRLPNGIEDEYMLDGHVRLHNSANPNCSGLSAIDGINELRIILHRPGSSVRLIGLSGVGKTRLLQALFDERIGNKPLDRSKVFYCDVGDNPNPDPRNFAESLISLQSPAILVVDNCTPELHRRLTSVCSASGSLISLITVEYDVREDQPEETEVFRLEPASSDIIKKIIAARFQHIGQVNAHTIAEFSGGNARIAIALANTVQRGENLGNLKDEDLFTRLFQQRNVQNNSLLRAAEACSLVYSFDGETTGGSDAELKLLSSLIGMNIPELYQNISELKRRELVQQRSIWRAVLPHAIANRLAKRALENIPLDTIYSVFVKNVPERFLQSFSRRLSYLHECSAAIEISKIWLSEGGLLGDIRNLNKLGITLFRNIAPVNPELILSAFERVLTLEEADIFFSRNNTHYSELTRILRSIAYDKGLFERSSELLCRFALSESPKENYNSIRDLLKSLFYIYLSGTHATPEQRLSIISKLMHSGYDEEINLGISLLSASLESWHFRSHYSFEFGARLRDYGYTPQSREEICHWFKLFLEYSVSLVISNQKISPRINALLAEKFRGLWTKVGLYDELEVASREICSKDCWKEGWVAVRTTKKLDGKNMEPDIFSRLNELDTLLKPTTLIEKAKLFAFSGFGSSLDIVDTIENEDASDDYHIINKVTRSLGRDVGIDEEIFKELLPDILSKDGFRLFTFGQGLADGARNPKKMWKEFREHLSIIGESTRNYQVLRGFLNAISEKDSNLVEEFLDEAVSDKVLAQAYPWLQTSIETNPKGVERLKKSIINGTTPIWQYRYLSYERVYESIGDDDICELLRLIASKNEGLEISIEILHMKLHGNTKQNYLSNSIISLSQELLLSYEFLPVNNVNNHLDYKLATIIKACFTGESAEDCARVLCNKIFKAYTDYNIYSMDYDDVVKALAIIQPKLFLDVFLGEDVNNDYFSESLFSEDIRVNRSPLNFIDNDLIINWCEANPDIRYPKVASAIIPFQKNEKESSIEWTSLAVKIITNCHDPIVILNKFKSALRPTSWSGSRAEIMESRTCLISGLKNHEYSSIADWACKEEELFWEEIRSERAWELKMESERNERFE